MRCDGRAFWLVGLDLLWQRPPSSCGTAPALHRTFPESSHVLGCPASIGRRLHCADVRIVSLLPSATEIVCLLGLEDQLVGVSADSDWPVEVVKRQPVLNPVSSIRASSPVKRLTSRRIDWQDVVAYAPEVLASHQALKVSSDGQRLEPYQ